MIILTNTGFDGTQTQTRGVTFESIIGYEILNESADGVGHLLAVNRVDGTVIPLIRKGSEDECIRMIERIEDCESPVLDLRIKHR